MADNKRLNKYISESGFCNRNEADEYIKSGKVLVNGRTASVGTTVMPGDKVEVDGKRVVNDKKKVYLAFNKPAGITCTTDHKDPTNIIDYIRYPEKIFPIGRLDKDSEGLILLTNDGDIVNKILRAGNNHDKEYLVTVDRRINDQFIKKMGAGVRIHNTVTRKCDVVQTGAMTFKITLIEGLNRQIRLMCQAFGYHVVALKRVRIMNIGLKGIETGTFKEIKGRELEDLLESVKNSSKTAGKSGGKKRQSKNNPSVRYAERMSSGKGKKGGNGKNRGGKAGSKSGGKSGNKKSPIRNKMKSKKK